MYGPFLSLLGASATVVGVVAGGGELLGYTLRLVSGLYSDRTGRYWLVTIVGYAINLLAVPALALAGRWDLAAVLMLAERVGKGLRTPSRDAMLSHATSRLGHGWGFALHEAMDQTGAITGPLLAAAVVAARHSYQLAFGILLAPAILAMVVLTVARVSFPTPRDLEAAPAPAAPGKSLPRRFWLYTAAIAILAVGFADFPLIAFHIKQAQIATDVTIPILYAVAMGVDAIAALGLGRLYDRIGPRALVLAFGSAALFAPFAFSGNLTFVVIGVTLWGIGMGAMESIVKAAVAEAVPSNRRATAFGIFNAVFGIAWFAGSATLGVLYDLHPAAVAVFATTSLAIGVFCLMGLTGKRFETAE